MIGPGRLVLVVGPSGAGKDTLISHARAGCGDDADVVFPRRVVTRPASRFEDHDTVSDDAFARHVAEGAFAFWWDAHGHKYGIPVSIDGDIRAGRAVVCNVSRTIVGGIRRRYACVAVALITAPAEILAARVAARDRPSDGSVEERTRRVPVLEQDLAPDAVIENAGTPEAGAAKLLDVVYGRF